TEPAIRHEDVMHEAVNRRERLLSSVPRREAVTDVLARRGDVRPEHRTALEGGQARVEERTERASPATVAAHSSTSFLEPDQRGRARLLDAGAQKRERLFLSGSERVES